MKKLDNSGGSSSSKSIKTRPKALSYQHTKNTNNTTNLQHFTLSSSKQLINKNKRFNLENMIQYIYDTLQKIYQKDLLNLQQTIKDFLNSKLIQIKSKIQQRLTLLQYLQQSLKYKSFTEIDVQIQKQWKKNVLLFSINTIWARCILIHQFKLQQQFINQYQKYRNFITNLTYYYFKNSLIILDSKNLQTFKLIYDDSSHQIINNYKDWKEIYHQILIKILENNNNKISKQNILDFNFDLNKLKINLHYLNPKQKQNQLKQTTKYIQQFSDQYRIHQKINILKKIRSTFLTEITQNCNKIKEKLKLKVVSQFEKDDILDCMIYCIVKGQITGIQNSLKTLMLLVGQKNDLLSKKGVDSYRADLQGALEYIQDEKMGKHVTHL